MLQAVIELRDGIFDAQQDLEKHLEELRKLGYAKLIYWDDKYESHRSWILSENKELIAKIDGIDGWSEHDDYYHVINDDTDYENIPQSAEVLRWTSY